MNLCPVSDQHLPHDDCDGKPAAYRRKALSEDEIAKMHRDCAAGLYAPNVVTLLAMYDELEIERDNLRLLVALTEIK